MIPKTFDEIDATDLLSLVANGASEGRALDFKRDAYGGSDADKRELLADVSSFANTVGGDLLIGVDETGGIATAVHGISMPDIDVELQRLESVISSGIEPRIPCRLRAVSVPGNTKVIVVRMEQSWRAPHRVTFKSHDRFYARNSSGKYALDVDELRDSFLKSSDLAERIDAFRIERVSRIGADETVVPMRQGPKLVLHLVPMEAFAAQKHVDLSRLHGAPNVLEPMSHRGYSSRINATGFLAYSQTDTGAIAYTQVYRSGVIEAVDGYILNQVQNGRITIPSIAYEERVLEYTRKYLHLQRDLGAAPPVFAFLSLLHVKEAEMGVSGRFYDLGDRFRISEDTLLLPGVTVPGYEVDVVRVMRTSLDIVWNACGYPASRNFDASGAWKPRV